MWASDLTVGLRPRDTDGKYVEFVLVYDGIATGTRGLDTGCCNRGPERMQVDSSRLKSCDEV